MRNINTKSGYIALMTSVFISIILLSITVSQNQAGWNLSFNLQNTENKIKSEILAKNCINIIIMQIINQTYIENTKNYKEGYCINYAPVYDIPNVGNITLKTQAIVNNSYTNIKVVVDKNQKMKVISFEEVPKF